MDEKDSKVGKHCVKLWGGRRRRVARERSFKSASDQTERPSFASLRIKSGDMLVLVVDRESERPDRSRAEENRLKGGIDDGEGRKIQKRQNSRE